MSGAWRAVDDGAVLAVAVGMLGRREVVVIGGEDGAVRCWDARTGEPAGPALPGSGEPVRDVAVAAGVVVAADGDDRLAGWEDGVPRFDDLYAGRRGLLPGRHRGATVLFAEDGRYVRALDPRTGVCVAELLVRGRYGDTYYDNAGNAFADDWPGHDLDIVALAYGRAGGEDLIATSDGETQYTWSADASGSVQCLLSGAPLTGERLALGRFGGRDVLACAEWRGDIHLYDPLTGEPAGPPLPGSGTVVGLAIARSTLVVTRADGPLYRWAAPGTAPATVPIPGEPAALAVSPATGLAYVAVADRVHVV